MIQVAQTAERSALFLTFGLQGGPPSLDAREEPTSQSIFSAAMRESRSLYYKNLLFSLPPAPFLFHGALFIFYFILFHFFHLTSLATQLYFRHNPQRALLVDASSFKLVVCIDSLNYYAHCIQVMKIKSLKFIIHI